MTVEAAPQLTLPLVGAPCVNGDRPCRASNASSPADPTQHQDTNKHLSGRLAYNQQAETQTA